MNRMNNRFFIHFNIFITAAQCLKCYTLLKNRILDFLNHQQVEIKYITHLKNFTALHNNSRADALIRKKEMSKYINKEIEALPLNNIRIELLFASSKY